MVLNLSHYTIGKQYIHVYTFKSKENAKPVFQKQLFDSV